MSWRRFWQRKRRDEELARELESYIRHEIDDNLARGMNPEEARYAAQRKFGNTTLVRETVHEMNTLKRAESLWRDLQYGLRQLRMKPGFALAAMLSLALGIGANTAIFTLVDQILVRLLPVRNPHELVQLQVGPGRFGTNDGYDGTSTFSYPLYRALEEQNTVFSGVTGERSEQASLVGEDRSESIGVGLVAGNYFDVLGVSPHLGRVLSPADNRTRNGQPVAVLQYDFWRNHFSGKVEVVGSTIRLNGSPFTVIGVGAPGFEGTDVGSPIQAWVPALMKPVITPTWDAFDDERYAWFYLFARLKPGVTLERAQAAMKVAYRQRQQQELKGGYFQKFPSDRAQFLRQSFSLIPAARGRSGLRSRFARPLIVLEWMVGLILLMACGNVANLLLARCAARQREIAIRNALGAGRGRVIQQLLAECFLLALGGGVAGLGLSAWLARVLLRMLPADPANLSLTASPDLRILAFTAFITLLTVFLFGLIPAWQGSRVSPGTTLKQETAGAGGASAHVRLRKLLVALQVGLASLLLIGAGLFARTLDNLRRVDLGFSTTNIASFRVRPATHPGGDRKLPGLRALIEGLATVPGVKAVGANSSPLLTGDEWDSEITIPGLAEKNGASPWSYFNAITPGYFKALGIPVKEGRDLTWSDWDNSRKVCLVNQALVGEYLDGAHPVGRLIGKSRNAPPDTEIVGVFGDAKYDDVRGKTPRQVFVLLRPQRTEATVYARIEGDPRAVMPLLRTQVRTIDPNLVVSDMRTLDEQLNMSLSNERMLSFLSGAFALLATLLAGIGLHGVLAFVVSRRTREIGIRVALGAERAQVVGMVVREALAAIVAGLAAGVMAAMVLGRYVESQLFGVKADDLPVFLLSTGVLLAVSLAATLVPARRASKIDPLRALRYE
jgi:predicted permease